MSIKATHKGTCQCCGASQKLPSDVLSKHGYTVKWGFFSGVCQGAGHLPYELSCDLIKSCIANAQEILAKDEATQASYRNRNDGNMAWLLQRRKPVRYGFPATYVWIDVEIFVKFNPFSDVADCAEGQRGYNTFHYIDPETKEERKIESYDYSISLENFVKSLNERRAKEMDAKITQIKRYITWQTKRLADWKLSETTPI